MVSALVYATIDEQPGATEGGVNGFSEALSRFSQLRTDRDFRNFVLARALLVGTSLGAPFLVLLARERTQTGLAVFFLLAALHDGVRLGRKTYVVDLAHGNKRTDYVSVSNTVIGVVLLAAGVIAAVVQQFGATAAILLFSAMAFVSLAVVRRLPEVQA